jgi:hypothetical protein
MFALLIDHHPHPSERAADCFPAAERLPSPSLPATMLANRLRELPGWTTRQLTLHGSPSPATPEQASLH